MSSEGAELLTAILTSPDMAASLHGRLAALPRPETAVIMDRVLEEARREQKWGTPPILDACIAVAAVDPSLGARVAGFLGERPPGQIRASIVPKISDQPWATDVFARWKLTGVFVCIIIGMLLGFCSVAYASNEINACHVEGYVQKLVLKKNPYDNNDRKGDIEAYAIIKGFDKNVGIDGLNNYYFGILSLKMFYPLISVGIAKGAVVVKGNHECMQIRPGSFNGGYLIRLYINERPLPVPESERPLPVPGSERPLPVPGSERPLPAFKEKKMEF